ncbi:MAG: type 1 glutamine amidotransferase [Lactobacillus sp.]|jgi:GMP synthase-like glutamine amidotransferase|nr:type 1 glutamine amidotransferase [Lactobacillus sp.]MCI2032386.1 type 1 glutamine amidotransferase [Lactobacillus sp.]
MQLHVLQHTDRLTVGGIADWAAAQSLELVMHRPDQKENLTPLNANALDGLIILDGPQDVAEHAPWVAAERILIRSLDKLGRPIFGIGFGAQQIARAFGSQVVPLATPVYGAQPITRCEDGMTVTAFQWQRAALLALAGSTTVYQDAAGEVQGFAYHQRITGIQFHLETPLAEQAAILASWPKPSQPLATTAQVAAQAELERLLTTTFL